MGEQSIIISNPQAAQALVAACRALVKAGAKTPQVREIEIDVGSRDQRSPSQIATVTFKTGATKDSYVLVTVRFFMGSPQSATITGRNAPIIFTRQGEAV